MVYHSDFAGTVIRGYRRIPRLNPSGISERSAVNSAVDPKDRGSAYSALNYLTMSGTKPDLELEEAFAQRRMSRALFSRLAGYMAPYRTTFAWNLVFTLLATASQLLGPKFIQVGIDRY